MRTALVAIAKDEDQYIDEWIEYHLKLGFDEIFIYENEWIYSGRFCKQSNIHLIPTNDISDDGRILVQIESYNDFIHRYNNIFSWAAFIDIDEFIVLKNGKNNIKDFLLDYKDFNAIYLRWRVFGDSNISEYNGEKGLISRFTKCQKDLHTSVKTIVNFDKCKTPVFKNSMHIIDDFKSEYGVTKKYHYEGIPIDYRDEDTFESLKIAYINHYYTKTKQEWDNKVKKQIGWFVKSRNDMFFKHMDNMFRIYHSNEYNEVEDLSALNFMRTGNFNYVNDVNYTGISRK